MQMLCKNEEYKPFHPLIPHTIKRNSNIDVHRDVVMLEIALTSLTGMPCAATVLISS